MFLLPKILDKIVRIVYYYNTKKGEDGRCFRFLRIFFMEWKISVVFNGCMFSIMSMVGLGMEEFINVKF